MRFVSRRRVGQGMMFLTGTERRVLDLDIIFRDGSNSRALPPTNSLPRATGADPSLAALEFAGAAIAPQQEFRMMGANGELERPLADSHFQVWKLATRRLRREGRHVWNTGVRSGPAASGSRKNYAASVTRTPPALRRPTAREISNFPHAPSQIWTYTAMDADASLGLLARPIGPP